MVTVAVSADVPKEVTLFGQKYSVEVHQRDGTFKNGVKIALQSDGAKKANLSFAEGADASADRLFVAAPIGTNDDGITGDQLYLLTGADNNGLFNTTVSAATQFLGGNTERTVGGRPQTVGFVSDTNKGVNRTSTWPPWTSPTWMRCASMTSTRSPAATSPTTRC